MLIHQRFRLCRGRRTQGSVARDLGVSRAQIANIETNYASPSADLLKQAAALFGVSVDWLAGRSLSDPPSEPSP
ncbi:MAG: helix-turn-helix transcriptional regulator [Candidatus Krumholzibacteriota bacterium]|nr:helix-turn-helix transcriptional regulator [Candidatus Krumholzibacteriota bacterium]